MADRTKHLEDFLLARYTPVELQRFILDGPDGERLVNDLPDYWALPPFEYIRLLVSLYERHGLVDHTFFERLKHERPRFQRQLDDLAALYGVDAAERREELLFRLFVSLFSPDELRRFLAFLPAGRELVLNLPGEHASARNIAYSAVELLAQRGLIERSFFNALVAEFPKRRDEIERTASAWNVPQLDDLDSQASPTTSQPNQQPREILPISEIFKTGGTPTITNVLPKQINELQVAMADPTKGLVIEGPSGIGKTTVVRTLIDHATHELRLYLHALKAADVERLKEALVSGFEGLLVIDDFHRLDPSLQSTVARALKLLADTPQNKTKLVLIGINQVAHSLVPGQLDLAGRYDRISIGRQPREKIRELIGKGEEAANIRFRDRDGILDVAMGSFFLAQLLCKTAAVAAGVQRTQADLRVVDESTASVILRVLSELQPIYHPLLHSLVTHDADDTIRIATLILLWMLGTSDDGSVLIREAIAQHSDLQRGFSALQTHALRAALAATPHQADLQRFFFYDERVALLSIEDPKLHFFLRKLDWAAFAAKAGIRAEIRDGRLVIRISMSVDATVNVAPPPKSVDPTTDSNPIRKQNVALILKGGGVKGLAFVGALRELSRFFEFTEFVGTSAGAITAALLASGYTHEELTEILREQDFGSFRDAGRFAAVYNFLFRGGMYPGKAFSEWMSVLLKRKIVWEGDVPLEKIPRRVRVYASALPDGGTYCFDSQGSHKDVRAAFAVRSSMAIPGFFTPTDHNGYMLVDGGLLNNFPLQEYRRDNPTRPFLALYLRGEGNRKPGFFGRLRVLNMFRGIVDVVLMQDELREVNERPDSIVVINPAPINSTDFSLSEEEKDFLVAEGRAAALMFLRDRRYPVDAGHVEAVIQLAEDKRARILKDRRAMRARRRFITAVGLLSVLSALAVGIYVFAWPV